MFIIINVGEHTLQTYTTPLENNLVKCTQKAKKYLYYLIQVSQLGESIIRKYTSWKCLVEHF